MRRGGRGGEQLKEKKQRLFFFLFTHLTEGMSCHLNVGTVFAQKRSVLRCLRLCMCIDVCVCNPNKNPPTRKTPLIHRFTFAPPPPFSLPLAPFFPPHPFAPPFERANVFNTRLFLVLVSFGYTHTHSHTNTHTLLLLYKGGPVS